MSDEVRETQAGGGDRESGEAAGAKLRAATVNENQEEQITKPAPKVKPQKEKDPKKVAAGKKLAEKNRQAKAALEREIKREIAEKEKENENSAGWLPEMSFQTVLAIVGVAFSAFEMYKSFRPKSSSPRAEPKQSDSDREYGVAAGAKLRAPGKNLRNVEERRSEQRADERSAAELCSGFASSSKIGMA